MPETLLIPSLRVRYWLTPYPVAEPEVYRWGQEALADEEFTEGRIELDGYGEVELTASGLDGHYQSGSFTFRAKDTDGLFRTLLRDPEKRYMVNREATLELLSMQGRAAGLEWRTLFTGIMSEPQLGDNDDFEATISDIIGSDLSALRLDDPILTARLDPLIHFGLPQALHGKPYPAIMGEHTDSNAEDAEGNSAAAGIIPLKFLGWQKFDNDGVPVDGEPVLLQPPTSLSATVNGATGTRGLVFSVSALSEGGETIPGPVFVVENAPATITPTDSITLSWSPPALYADKVIAYRVFVGDYVVETDTPTRYLKLLNNGGTWTNPPETSYTYTGSDAWKSPGPKIINTAQVVTTDIDQSSGPKGVACGKMLVGIGAIKVNEIYVSDVGGAGEVRDEPKRIPFEVVDGGMGADIIGPWNANWPHDDPWVTFADGVDATIIYMLGPRLEDHINGVVTAAVNVCGYDAGGRQTGPVVNQAFYALQHFVNEFRLREKGRGYRSGAMGTLETYENGVAMIRTSEIEKAQDISIARIGGLGYLADWYIDDDTTMRTFLQWFCQTFACWVTVDEHGQFYPFLLDELADLSTTRVFRESSNIVAWKGPKHGWNEIKNRQIFSYAWNADQQKWRIGPETMKRDTSRSAHRGKYREPTPLLELRCSSDRETVRDARGRELNLRMDAPVYQVWETGMEGLEARIGDVVRIEHSKGLGANGWELDPFLVLSKRYNPNKDLVTLRALYVGRAIASAPGAPAVDGSGNPLPGGGWGWDLWQG